MFLLTISDRACDVGSQNKTIWVDLDLIEPPERDGPTRPNVMARLIVLQHCSLLRAATPKQGPLEKL